MSTERDAGRGEAEKRHPWFKFFPSDWQGDELLPMCSLSARGLLVEFMCLMHRADPYGHLLVNGARPTDAALARLVRASSPAELRRLRAELLEHGVLSTTAAGTIYSRRMVRKAQESAAGRLNGAKGGNPSLKRDNAVGYPDGLSPPDNAQIPEAIDPEIQMQEKQMQEKRTAPAVAPRQLADWAAGDWHAYEAQKRQRRGQPQRRGRREAATDEH